MLIISGDIMRQYQLLKLSILIVITASIVFNCDKSKKPLSYEYEILVKEQIIPENEVPRNWDNTFYQQNPNWKGFSRISAADSLVNVLKNTNLPLSDMWFPYSDVECTIMLINGSQVILKLSEPDPNIYKYGFGDNEGFPIACIKEWKHYKFAKALK
jgi:hypothetical protein